MPSAADECWRLSGDCSRWAEECSDNAARLAFRQMAKVWAQLAFSHHFTMPSDDASADTEKSTESSERSEAAPTSTVFRARFP